MIQPEGSNRTEDDPHHKWHAWPEQKIVMGLEKEEPSIHTAVPRGSSHILNLGTIVLCIVRYTVMYTRVRLQHAYACCILL